MDELTTRINASIDKFRADPAAAKAAPTVTATLVNGHARLSSGPFNWDADLGPGIGGENLAPSPTQYLLGALAGCGVVFLRDTLAPQFGVEVDAIDATARCTSDAAGLLGIEGTDPALGDIELSIVVDSTSPQDRIDAMFAAWRERCPIYLGLLRPNAITLDLAVASRTA
jgi:uncharacterized OsmC-like protein